MNLKKDWDDYVDLNGALVAPIAVAKATSWNGPAIFPRGNHPRSPPFLPEGHSEYWAASWMRSIRHIHYQMHMNIRGDQAKIGMCFIISHDLSLTSVILSSIRTWNGVVPINISETSQRLILKMTTEMGSCIVRFHLRHQWFNSRPIYT